MFNLFRKNLKATKPPPPKSLLDIPLLHLSESPYDILTVGNACEGIHIFGGTGSGKTSGSGKALAKSFLNIGMGGIVLTAKPDELATWKNYAKETNRLDDLLIIAPDQPHRFNFLNYECTRKQTGGGQTENIVDLFMSVIKACERGEGQSGGSDPFWQRAAKQLLRNAIDLCKLSTGEVTLAEIMTIIETAPRKDSDIIDAETGQRTRKFRNSAVGTKLAQISKKEVNNELSPVQKNDYKQTLIYWTNTFPEITDKTRSGIITTFTAMADMFLRGELSQLFCTDTTITPEHTFDNMNKIIVINLPIKQWGQVGIAAQIIFKFLWQQAIERRNIEKNTLPSFLWADEAHLFVTDYDQEFLTTARSSRACMVYLSQNMPNYLAALGQHSKNHVDSLLGNFQTKIFHQNSDNVTNIWASELIGKDIQIRYNSGSSYNAGSNAGDSSSQDNYSSSSGENTSVGKTSGQSEYVDYDIMPVEFTRLVKGGQINNCIVGSIIHQGGRVWENTAKSYIYSNFNQND